MGVVNVTPDSFSDGGVLVDESGVADHDAAVEQGLALWRDGADIVDVGGESTRPGSRSIDEDEEINRVLPVVGRLAASGLVVSVDTSKATVADAALEAGAEIVNDVTALQDPEMTDVIARREAGVVLMHMRGRPETMQQSPSYDDVVAEVSSYLERRASEVMAAGIERERISLDPGIGFGKTGEHNLMLLRALDRLVAHGYPVVVGASRKSFLGSILDNAGRPAGPAQRDPATVATVALSIAAGAAVVRVHNVAMALQAARTADAIVRGRFSEGG